MCNYTRTHSNLQLAKSKRTEVMAIGRMGNPILNGCAPPHRSCVVGTATRRFSMQLPINHLTGEETDAINILDALHFTMKSACGLGEKFTTHSPEDSDDDGSTDDSTAATEGDEIFDAIKSHSFCPRIVSELLGPRLREIISTTCASPVDELTMKTLMKKNFNKKLFRTKREKAFIFSVEVVLKSAIVFHISKTRLNIHDDIDTVDELLAEYNEYTIFNPSVMDETEMQYLLNFRNMMKVALQIIPAKRNKMLLISICSVLEGSGKIYVTGGTQSISTSRRMCIFEHESGIQKRRRPERKVVPTEKKRSRKKSSAATAVQLF